MTQAKLSAEAGNKQSLHYRNGTQDPNAYDFYSIVEHEVDELLGTSSCIGTGGGVLANTCPNAAPSAVDLFGYNNGSRVLLDGTPGAYFSFDGGATNGAGGAIYNTVANGNDYADFASNCAHIQDATGCLGGSFDITSDGNPERSILDAVGYNRSEPNTPIPEPGTLALFATGITLLAAYRRLCART